MNIIISAVVVSLGLFAMPESGLVQDASFDSDVTPMTYAYQLQPTQYSLETQGTGGRDLQGSDINILQPATGAATE